MQISSREMSQALATGISQGIAKGVGGLASRAAGTVLIAGFTLAVVYPDFFNDVGVIGNKTVELAKGAIASASASGEAVANKAKVWVDKDFKAGVEAQCAVFVRAVLKSAGVNVGVTTKPWDAETGGHNGPAMARSFFGNDMGERISNPKDAQPGDIVGFTGTYGIYKGTRAISHVGIIVETEPKLLMIDRSTMSAPVRKRPVFGTFVGSSIYIIRPYAYKSVASGNKFDQIYSFTSKWEGAGCSNHRADSGGLTCYGITQATYSSRESGSVTSLSAKSAKEFFRKYYWEQFKCDRYEYPLALACFDSYVNFNPQSAQGFFSGVDTSDPKRAAIAIAQRRMAFRRQRVQETPSQVAFLTGWLNRDRELLQKIQESK